jgi:hypothetical protein
MLRPIAGLMCIAVITLGVATSGGQEEEKKANPDLAAPEKKPETPAGTVVPPAERTIEIRIGDDGEAVIEENAENRDVEARAKEVIIKSRDGRVVETLNRAWQPNVAVRFVAGAPVIDPGTRDALDKLIAGLKEEAKRLEAEGKKEESGRKLQSIRAVEQLLHPGPLWGAFANQPGAPLQQPALGTPFGQPGPWHGGSAYAAVPADAFAQWAGGSPEAATLMRKSHALLQAAHQLQQAGLEGQSRDLARQAETLRAEADKIRAQSSAQRQGQGGSGGGFPGGHPMELQRSLHELQEQIQQLRKEIGELRELLQQTHK